MAELEDVKGITDTHEEYDCSMPKVKRSRDCVDGTDAIKEATTDYFPALTGEIPLIHGAESSVTYYVQGQDGALHPRNYTESPLYGQYEKRIGLAAVYEATDKTLDALAGALLRTETQPTVPDSILPHLDNIDLAGTPYQAFKHQASQEELEAGRYGVLVDWSSEQGRPFWRPYETEQIDNWLYGIVNGQKVLVQVKLKETLTERSSSGFGGEAMERYRVLELNAAGQVEVTVYTKRKQDQNGLAKTVWQKDGPVLLTRQGVPLTEIPFVCFGRLDLDLCPQKPPLLGIADLQLDHYRLDGNVKWAIQVGCMGALFVAGDGDSRSPKPYYYGGTVNRLDQGATVEFVTLPPEMVDRALQKQDSDKQEMALMGARMLLAPKREAETAEASLIQRDGESASLSMISRALSAALTKCLQYHAMWMGIEDKTIGDELSRDFFPHRLTPQEIAAQLDMVNQGRMSVETFLENMYSGQITREPDVERERIDAEPPAPPADGTALVTGLKANDAQLGSTTA